MLIEPKKSMNLAAEMPLQEVYQAAGIPELFGRSLGGALTWQQRNETTVQRALRSPHQALQWVAALLAWGAFVRGGGEERSLVEFLRDRGMKPTIEALRVPLDAPDRSWGEAHVARSPAEAPIVAAIAVVDWAGAEVQAARLALTGVWRSPVQLAESAAILLGGGLEEARIDELASAVQQEISPPDNFMGSADYRREMAAVLTRRVLTACRDEKPSV